MKKSLILSILMLLAVSNAFATNGMRMIGFGPVQDSMGGASAGVNLDAASILTNPAGIQSLGSRVDFGASYFVPTVKTETATGTEFTSDKKASPVPAFGMVVPLNADMTFGLGAYGVSGMGVDYDLGTSYGGLLYTNYTNMRFAPGLSYKINDMVSVGGTLNLMYATMEYSMNGGSDFGYAQIVDMSSSSFGYGATIGVTVKPIEMLTIGLVYETTSKFQDFKFNQYISGMGTDRNTLTFDQPMNATIGFGLKPIAGLVIAFDVQWIKWSETNGNDLPEYTGSATGDQSFDMQWDDQIIYKLGLQYEVMPILKVRAGVNYGKMPLSDANDAALQANLFFPAVSEWHYTAGIGVKLTEKLAVDLGYMYSPEAKIDTIIGETKMTQYSLDMGIAYNF